jgi:hypothetical protein
MVSMLQACIHKTVSWCEQLDCKPKDPYAEAKYIQHLAEQRALRNQIYNDVLSPTGRNSADGVREDLAKRFINTKTQALAVANKSPAAQDMPSVSGNPQQPPAASPVRSSRMDSSSCNSRTSSSSDESKDSADDSSDKENDDNNSRTSSSSERSSLGDLPSPRTIMSSASIDNQTWYSCSSIIEADEGDECSDDNRESGTKESEWERERRALLGELEKQKHRVESLERALRLHDTGNGTEHRILTESPD